MCPPSGVLLCLAPLAGRGSSRQGGDGAHVPDRISVSTAEPFATTAQVPHALRLALGSVELDTLRDALEKVKRVISDRSY